MAARMRTRRLTPGWKRCLDIAGSVALLILLSPVFLGVALLVGIAMGPPILFRQTRPGLSGKPFMLYKFRTMREGPDAGDAERLTKVGLWLRSTSLDELPELWNVIRGDMSLVGPRPLLMDYLPLYSAEQARRHEVRPGLTGLAQVNGRNALTWHERFQLDVWYVDHQGFLLDARILFRTIAKVIQREGIAQRDHATGEPFRGNAP